MSEAKTEAADLEMCKRLLGASNHALGEARGVMALATDVTAAVACLHRLIAERDKLQRFKSYVHARLDAAGVSADPESPHKAEGCRIGGRLDEVFAVRAELLAACEMAAKTIETLTVPGGAPKFLIDIIAKVKSVKEGN